MKFIHVLTMFTVFLLLSSATIFPVSPAHAAIPGTPTNGGPSGPPSETSITITWTASSNSPTGYKIESASETGFGQFGAFTVQTEDTGNTATTKTISGLTAGQFFKFRISGINGDGTSSPSSEFFAGTLHPANQDFTNGNQEFTEGQFFGDGTKFAEGQTFTGAQTFGANQQFNSGIQFAANQNFSNNVQTFGANQQFGAGTLFAAGQTFTGVQTFGTGVDFHSATFNAAQSFGAGANFTGAQTFVGANTFGDNVKFGAGQTFSAAQTFGTGANFTGNTDFSTGQSFGASTHFANGQQFQVGETYDFTGSSMGFGSGTTFGDPRTFGAGANFTGAQTFVGANTFGDNVKFGAGQTFSAAQTFGTGANFTGNTDFSTGQSFGASTHFANGQQFQVGETYDFTGSSMGFGSGTTFGDPRTFGAGANFTGAQTFVGANTFGNNVKFGAGQTFDNLQTFGAGANFTGDTIFKINQVFPTNAQFADDQDFGTDDFDFAAASMIFGSGTNFGEARTFGTGMNFADGNQTFIGANNFGNSAQFAPSQVFGSAMTFGNDPIFKPGTKFNTAMTWGKSANFTGAQTFLVDQTFGRGAHFDTAQDFSDRTHNFDAFDMTFGANTAFQTDGSERFGTGANFTGTINFPNNQVFPVLAEFAASQQFPSGETVTFSDFAKFGAGTNFGEARAFQDFTFFANGNQTFVGPNTFGPGTHFGDSQGFTAAQTFGTDTFFGKNADFTSLVQDFKTGAKFDTGVSFKSGQTLGTGLVPAYGLLLEGITCPADGTCIPDASKYLAPGELLAPGIDPAAISSAISNKTTSFEIPGLGFEMSFANVTTSGKVNVDPIDPATLASSSAGSTAGSRTLTASGIPITTIGTVMEVSLDTAKQSGTMNITLPYDEANIPAGVAEGNLNMVHYVGGQWVTENNCTVDTVNNKITCTVTSLSPFGIGAGPSSGGGGGGGGGGGDTLSPSFTTTFSEDDYPLRISGVNYPLVMTENIPTQTIKTGESIQIELMMYENSGPQNVRHVDMYLNQKGNRILNDNLETIITFDSDQMQLQDPLNLIQSANVVSSVLGNKIHFLFDVSFSKAIDTSDILFRMWDTHRNAAYLHIPGALQVIDSEDMSSGDAVINDDVVDTSQDSILPTINESSFSDAFDQWAGYATTSMPDTDFLNQLGMDAEHVPKWFKQNNAKWFKDGLISQDDFVTALNDLNNRGIL